MPSNLLQLCQAAANNAGVNQPASIIGNSDPAAVRLLQLARREAKSLSLRANWVTLVTEHIFIANGTSDYELPADYRSLVDDTLWDRTRYWRMRGAMSPQQWQMYKSSSLGQATIERRWRIRLPSGAAAGSPAMFSLDPAIGDSDNTSEFVFEYVSNNWCQSVTTFALDEIVIVSGGTGHARGDTLVLAGGTSSTPAVILVVDANETTGVIESAQVQTPGVYAIQPASPAVQASTSGVGVGASFAITTATMAGRAIPDWTADTDVPLIDDNLIELGLIWRLLSRIGLAYAEEKDEYDREVGKAIARDGGTAILSISPYNPTWALLSPWNVQDGNWPGSR